MGIILGIDAAWTAKNPSGVSLISTGGPLPKLVRASPSYEDFVLGTNPDGWCAKHHFQASLADVLDTASQLVAAPIDVIAVDMPIAKNPVRKRRACDHAISKAYGGRGCATHTPTLLRPGEISDRFLADAECVGFSLATSLAERPQRALIEVYPHVAALQLCRASHRVPYKIARGRRYWPTLTASERRDSLRKEWDNLLTCMAEKIEFTFHIDCDGKAMRYWKAWEDVIDAMICCWVGHMWLEGLARPYGDETAAIWVPHEVERCGSHELA